MESIMEERVLFGKKISQRKFFDLVIDNLNCLSLRGILQFGIETNYSSLKNYYSRRRLISRGFFENLCYLAKINPETLGVKYLNPNWGQVKGGRK